MIYLLEMMDLSIVMLVYQRVLTLITIINHH